MEDLTLERFVIPRPITKVIKEVLYYPIIIETKKPFANQSTKKKYIKIHIQMFKLYGGPYMTFLKKSIF